MSEEAPMNQVFESLGRIEAKVDSTGREVGEFKGYIHQELGAIKDRLTALELAKNTARGWFEGGKFVVDALKIAPFAVVAFFFGKDK